MNSCINVQIVFDGFNLAEEDREVKVTYYKVSAAQLLLITSDDGEQRRLRVHCLRPRLSAEVAC